MIVDAVQCELASVYLTSKYASSLDNWLARVTLDLKVTYDASAGGPTYTVLPVLSSGTLTVPVGPDLSDTSFRNANIVFDVQMRDLKRSLKKHSDPKMPSCPMADTGLPQAQGSLGLGDWVATLALAAGRPDYATLHEAAYDLEFTIVRGVHGGFTFKSVTANIEAGEASWKKTNNNHMNVVFQSASPAPVTKSGKKKVSPGTSYQLDLQRQRFLPQRLIIQNQRGLLPP